MRFAVRTEHAERIITESYAGASKPLTKTTSVRNPHDVQSWQSNPREERRADTARKFAAVPFYLELARYSPEQLPSMSFPAVFDLADGQRRYPDKGLIKSLIDQNLVSGLMVSEELVFVLTQQGQKMFARPRA
ncbi:MULTISPECIES: hypothetical protein [unclassified Ruegeria]|uniref:hypothetical protein n=1 Tax=unclassified Ruegeria TaxID=2625375 RepID=UPI0014910190|nr:MULTISPECIES: hypothetical protein [unclassified Ruegeria]NOD36635.1 hypothetical protein [Ruegeria sp. HKCCD7296]NOE43866.1 hypothetical protein [Ruegeria sp. HKCCD7319]